MSEITTYLQKVANQEDLTQEEAARTFQIIMLGGATPAQIAALLMGMRLKGETVDEITGAAQAMRAKSGKINAPENAMDTCGTGGDGSGILNVSTAVSFVVASCGIPIAKHGNRAISSRSGSADVLSALGVNINATEERVEQALHDANICFMMAPKFHTAMRHVAPIRSELGIRTIFNLLGPLCNPASTKYHLLGVYSREWVDPLAHVLSKLGTTSAWVVHGHDGMDELSTTGPSYVASLKDGVVTSFKVSPEDVGLARVSLEDLKGGDAFYNARKLKDLLSGAPGAYRDIVLLNAGAALVVSGLALSLSNGITMAAEHIDNGLAKQVLDKLVEITSLDLLDGES